MPEYNLPQSLDPDISVGTVKQVSTRTYTARVLLEAGRRAGSEVECRIRAIQKNNIAKTGSIIIPEIGDYVYVDWHYGPTPVIGDYVPEQGEIENKKDYKSTILPIRSFGGEDKFYKAEGKKPYRWGPPDLMPGDKIWMGKLQNFVGVLAGGLSIIRGGPLSQLILSKYRDMVTLIARRLNIHTDFGWIKSTSNNGQATLEIMGHDDVRIANQHKESNWDYHVKFGGKNLFQMDLHKDKFQFKVDRDGHATVNSARSFTINLSSPPEIFIDGNVVNRITGHREESVNGDQQQTVRGVDTRKVGRKNQVCSGAYNKVVGGPCVQTYLHKKIDEIRGTKITDLLSTIGKETHIAAGDYDISIGNPLKLGTPSPLLLAQAKTGRYNLTTFSGDINFTATVMGSLTFKSLLGDVDFKTIAGNFGFLSGAGDASIFTGAGAIDLTTGTGDISATSLLGKISLMTGVQNIELSSIGGSIKLQAGTAMIQVGPAGIKIMNAGQDLLAELLEIMSTLSSTMTPGYGGPITTAALFGTKHTLKLTAIKGA